jgi:hypothetical protein
MGNKISRKVKKDDYSTMTKNYVRCIECNQLLFVDMPTYEIIKECCKPFSSNLQYSLSIKKNRKTMCLENSSNSDQPKIDNYASADTSFSHLDSRSLQQHNNNMLSTKYSNCPICSAVNSFALL